MGLPCDRVTVWPSGRLRRMGRPLTPREREILHALLAVDFEGAEHFRSQANDVEVVRDCDCGCPSIDFHLERGAGMHIRVNAAIQGMNDGLFLFTVGNHLGGIEYVGVSENGDPSEFPDPGLLTVEPV
jgi:hypothetical protein